MRPLPLFPLPIVLLPDGALPLHIFEPRYRRMLGYCLEHDRRFGLIYHDPDVSGPFLIEAGRVGCVAEVKRVKLMDDGRSLILTKGRERFRIQRAHEDPNTPYYQAFIEPFPDDMADLDELRRRRRASLDLFLTVLEAMPDAPRSFPSFDVDEELSYRLAATVDTTPVWHQELLETSREADRLRQVDAIFRAAQALIETDTDASA